MKNQNQWHLRYLVKYWPVLTVYWLRKILKISGVRPIDGWNRQSLLNGYYRDDERPQLLENAHKLLLNDLMEYLKPFQSGNGSGNEFILLDRIYWQDLTADKNSQQRFGRKPSYLLQWRLIKNQHFKLENFYRHDKYAYTRKSIIVTMVIQYSNMENKLIPNPNWKFRVVKAGVNDWKFESNFPPLHSQEKIDNTQIYGHDQFITSINPKSLISEKLKDQIKSNNIMEYYLSLDDSIPDI